MKPADPAVPADRRAPRPVVVLGIDPGTLVVGYGALVDAARGPRLLAAGVLRARRSDDVPSRLARLRGELDELLARLAPSVVVVERAFAARNVQSALRIGEGRGVALACGAATGARIVELAPAVAKKALVGHGGADKAQVARMVAHVLGIDVLKLPFDATDALALAFAQLQRARIAALTGSAPASAALPDALRRAPRARAGPRRASGSL